MIKDSALGRKADYPDTYAPELLYAIERCENRAALGLAAELPFHGTDIWNVWELTWLRDCGQPVIAAAEIRVPADSTNIVESKSLKLYLNSYSMSRFASTDAVAQSIRSDLSNVADADVSVRLLDHDEMQTANIEQLPGLCIDDDSTSCEFFDVDATLLLVDRDNYVEESLHSHLLRSLCPVTSQPDAGSVLVQYRGPEIDRASLLRYIVSFRQHSDFHEACVERMFLDINERCEPEQLTIYARYQRRGGIDINPFRSNATIEARNTRLWRQ